MQEALEAIYREFSLPTPAVIEGCPCCLEEREVDVLLTTPLRELTGQALWPYVSGAFLTVGGEHDFRYFLPRILEISVRDPSNANDPEIVIGKLALANWRLWSVQEQDVINEFLDAWFESSLAKDLETIRDGWMASEAESVLCGAARSGIPIQRWLVRLSDPLFDPVLWELKRRFPYELSAFWKDNPEGFRELSTILSQGQA